MTKIVPGVSRRQFLQYTGLGAAAAAIGGTAATYASVNASISTVNGSTTGTGGSVTVNGQSISVTGSDTVQTLIDRINNVSSSTGVTAAAQTAISGVTPVRQMSRVDA